jgi:hypothetical protein
MAAGLAGASAWKLAQAQEWTASALDPAVLGVAAATLIMGAGRLFRNAECGMRNAE